MKTKHTTFYKDRKGGRQIYTTIKHTPMHEHLRKERSGKTYVHDESAVLFFVAGMPLDKPIGKGIRVVAG